MRYRNISTLKQKVEGYYRHYRRRALPYKGFKTSRESLDKELPQNFYLSRFNITNERSLHPGSILVEAIDKYIPYNIPNLNNIQRECGFIGTRKNTHEFPISFQKYKTYFYFKNKIRFKYMGNNFYSKSTHAKNPGIIKTSAFSKIARFKNKCSGMKYCTKFAPKKSKYDSFQSINYNRRRR